MSPAVTSLIALGIAIVLSCTSQINVGVLAVGFAWVIGVFHAGMKADAVAAGFPVSLFVTLAGVTLLFGMAETNGTLARVTGRVFRLTGGGRRVLPIVFFALACAVSSAGPGAISAVALLVPLAMAVGGQAGVPRLLTALMVANGANAGNLSLVSAVGVIANTKMADAGIVGHESLVWAANFGAHVLVGIVAYVLFGGLGRVLVGAGSDAADTSDTRGAAAGEPAGGAPASASSGAGGSGAPQTGPLATRHLITMAVIGIWIVAVLFGGVHVGLAAFAAAGVLAIGRFADEGAAIKAMPWGVMVMVCGISVLIGVLEKSGGMDLFSSLLAAIATPDTINGTIAFVSGLISTWSSTSGVVLPAFLPTVPDLVAKVGGGDPLGVALSINIGSALVDVSPLSTLGALCVAAVSGQAASARLFRQLMTWGLSMALVGGIVCQLFVGALAS